MVNLLAQYEEKQLQRLSNEEKPLPEFQAGDTIRVNTWIVEGKNRRIQAFEGLCIAKRNRGINSSVTVRKISHNEGVERVFSTHSPLIDSIEIVRKGVVRRAKLYYMRELRGKAARIKEKRDFNTAEKSEDKPVKKAAKAEKTETKEEK